MTNEIESIDTYAEMNLKSQLVDNINYYGSENLTPLYQRAIAPISKGKDIIIHAQADMDATIALCTPVIQSIDINKTLCGFSDSMNNDSLAAVGGVTIRDDMEKLRRGPHCCRALRVNAVKLVIVHEADVTLKEGSKGQFLDIFQFMTEETQIVAHSPNLSAEVLEVIKKLMREPILISDKSSDLSLEDAKQFYVAVPDEGHKFETFCGIYNGIPGTKAVVFCSTFRKADWLVNKLDGHEFSVSIINNGMDQKQRYLTVEKFLSGSSRILVTTDDLIRGISMQQVPLVINYDLLSKRENYLSRIGRQSGGKQNCVALSFVSESDGRHMEDIKQFYKTQTKEMPENVAAFI